MTFSTFLIIALLIIIVIALVFIILKQFYPTTLKKIQTSFSDGNIDDDENIDNDIFTTIIILIFIVWGIIFFTYQIFFT